MAEKRILKLHWKLYFPLIGLLWLIIGITIVYFVCHEKDRQKENLENRLLNVNNTVIDAYERGGNLQNTVDFIRLFTDNTTLAPLHITVYDSIGNLLADNPESVIPFYDSKGRLNPDYDQMLDNNAALPVKVVMHEGEKCMISSQKSPDGRIYSFAALPYEEEVTDFLSIDPMVWIVVIALGLVSSVLAYIGVKTVCGNVYNLRDFARAASSDKLPDNIPSMNFSKDELGEVSRNLMILYRDKIHAEEEKLHHERQIGMNISHELKTPVGIVNGYLDTLLNSDDMPPELRRKFLLRAKQNAERLTSIVSDVAMVMRLQEDNGYVRLEPVNFHTLVSQLSDDISHGHVADNMTFVYDIPDDCIIMGHASLLTSALLNLVYNAARHSGGDRISLKWAGHADGLHTFIFADNGTGVGEEHLGRLFDLFYRVDAGRSRKNGGSGLGLPLVKRIFNVMKGSVTVTNAPEGGLVYTFTIPSADAGTRT